MIDPYVCIGTPYRPRLLIIVVYGIFLNEITAEMALGLESVGPHLDRITEDWSNSVDYGHGWVTKIFAAKYNAVETSWRVVDTGLDLLGGFGIFKSAGYERLWRDARLGRIHPANAPLTHELIGKLSLGINPDEQPRWG